MSNRPRDGDPSHDHDVTFVRLLDDGAGGWTVLWGCADCPARWEGPISVAELDAVECEPEAGQGRAA